MPFISDKDRGIKKSHSKGVLTLNDQILVQLRRKFKNADVAVLERRRNLITLFEQVSPLKAASLLFRLKRYRRNDEMSRLFHGELHEKAAIEPILRILRRKVREGRQLIVKKDDIERFIREFSIVVSYYINTRKIKLNDITLGAPGRSLKRYNQILSSVQKVLLNLDLSNNPPEYDVPYDVAKAAFDGWEHARSKVEEVLREYELIGRKGTEFIQDGWFYFQYH
ncbi:MAG: hypothetical protein HRU41_42095 [Saprospiraceae bacterium]|nr:hypothetical protein [Saprospiraceae bacterium]